MALQPTQNTVAYWPAEAGREAAFEAGQFPVLISDCALGAFYGIPATSAEEKGMWKFDRHGGPALAHRELSDKDPARGAAEVAESAAYVREHVRWVGAEPVSVEPCVHTMTRDEDFIIDRVATRPNIAVVRNPSHARPSHARAAPTLGCAAPTHWPRALRRGRASRGTGSSSRRLSAASSRSSRSAGRRRSAAGRAPTCGTGP
eukprot:SAG11_NODE_4436_length_1895_cov_4.459354_1_plen_202_part_10